jgi:hypothetical protein
MEGGAGGQNRVNGDANLPDHLLRNPGIILAACNGLVTGLSHCDEG